MIDLNHFVTLTKAREILQIAVTYWSIERAQHLLVFVDSHLPILEQALRIIVIAEELMSGSILENNRDLAEIPMVLQLFKTQKKLTPLIEPNMGRYPGS